MPEKFENSNQDNNPVENKKYIQVTQEDYEFALASKVLSKTYKIVFIGITIIVVIFGFIGINLQNSVTNFEEDMNAKLVEFGNLSLQVKIKSDTLDNILEKNKYKLDMFKDYSEDLAGNYQNSASSIFKQFVASSDENYKFLASLEIELQDELKKYQADVDELKKSLSDAKDEIKRIDDTKKIVAANLEISIKNKVAVEKIIKSFNNSGGNEVLLIKNGETKSSNFLGKFVKFQFKNRKYNLILSGFDSKDKNTLKDIKNGQKISVDNLHIEIIEINNQGIWIRVAV